MPGTDKPTRRSATADSQPHGLIRKKIRQATVNSSRQRSYENQELLERRTGPCPALHAALQNHAPRRRRPVPRGPSRFKKRQRTGWAQDLPLDIIRYLLEVRPESARKLSQDGLLPLHFAASVGASPQVFELLRHPYPEAVRVATAAGWLPLQFAAANPESPLPMIQSLLELYPEAVEIVTGDDHGMLPLHLSARGRRPGKHRSASCGTVAACRPSQVQRGVAALALRQRRIEFIVGGDPDPLPPLAHDPSGDDRRRTSPAAPRCFTRGAVAEGAIPGPILAIVSPSSNSRGPDSVALCGRQGVLMDPESLGVARYLLEEWPEAIRQATNEGLLPLHCLAGKKVPHYVDDNLVRCALTRFLVRMWLPKLRVTTHVGRLPAHVAAASTARVDMMELMVEEHPKSLQARDANGSLPLHQAASREEPDLEVVRYLVRRRPESVRERDGFGALPLHVAIVSAPKERLYPYSTAVAGILALLVEASPESIYEAVGGGGPDGLISLHLAASSDAPLYVVYLLLRLRPESIRELV